MENCEAMTSSPHSFAYSYWLVKKCFFKICETSKCHNFLIFQPIFIRYSLLCLKIFTLSSEIKLNLLWSSSLMNKKYLYVIMFKDIKYDNVVSIFIYDASYRTSISAFMPSKSGVWRIIIINSLVKEIQSSITRRITCNHLPAIPHLNKILKKNPSNQYFSF